MKKLMKWGGIGLIVGYAVVALGMAYAVGGQLYAQVSQFFSAKEVVLVQTAQGRLVAALKAYDKGILSSNAEVAVSWRREDGVVFAQDFELVIEHAPFSTTLLDWFVVKVQGITPPKGEIGELLPQDFIHARFSKAVFASMTDQLQVELTPFVRSLAEDVVFDFKGMQGQFVGSVFDLGRSEFQWHGNGLGLTSQQQQWEVEPFTVLAQPSQAQAIQLDLPHFALVWGNAGQEELWSATIEQARVRALSLAGAQGEMPRVELQATKSRAQIRAQREMPRVELQAQALTLNTYERQAIENLNVAFGFYPQDSGDYALKLALKTDFTLSDALVSHGLAQAVAAQLNEVEIQALLYPFEGEWLQARLANQLPQLAQGLARGGLPLLQDWVYGLMRENSLSQPMQADLALRLAKDGQDKMNLRASIEEHWQSERQWQEAMQNHEQVWKKYLYGSTIELAMDKRLMKKMFCSSGMKTSLLCKAQYWLGFQWSGQEVAQLKAQINQEAILLNGQRILLNGQRIL